MKKKPVPQQQPLGGAPITVDDLVKEIGTLHVQVNTQQRIIQALNARIKELTDGPPKVDPTKVR